MKSALFQVAMSVTDIHKTIKFYNDILGFLPVRKPARLKGIIPSRIQGHRKVNALISWMNDANPSFQLEFFQYFNPPARPMPSSVRQCDTGYSRLGIWVADFDGVIDRLKVSGTSILGVPEKFDGCRRACLRDPDGVYLDLMEKPATELLQPRPGAKVAVQFVSVSVPNLEQAEDFFITALGMERSDAVLHTPEIESICGIAGAETKASVLKSGNILIELVEYLNPRGMRIPEDRHIGDAGLWHIAMLFNKRKDFMECYRRALAAGHSAYSKPVSFGFMDFVYMKSSQGFTVEFAHFPQWMGRFAGI